MKQSDEPVLTGDLAPAENHVCKVCGAPTEPGDVYCITCGAKL